MDDRDGSQGPNDTGHWQFKPGDSESTGQQSNPVETEAQDIQDSVVASDGNFAPSLMQPSVPETDPNDNVTWTASEFIAHQKSIGWYAMLALVVAVLALLVYVITKDKISTGVVIIAGIVFGISAARKPRTLPYLVDNYGLHINNKLYAYKEFRSYAMLDEGAFSSIVFMPLKRFMPLLTIYYDPKDADKISSIIGARLPMETHKLDLVDQLMRRIRF